MEAAFLDGFSLTTSIDYRGFVATFATRIEDEDGGVKPNWKKIIEGIAFHIENGWMAAIYVIMNARSSRSRTIGERRLPCNNS
jgi:hypothetical protein